MKTRAPNRQRLGAFLLEREEFHVLFSSNVFLFAYLPIVLALYYLCPRRLRNLVLLAVSLLFYGWGEPVYVFLMVGVIILNYLCGAWIGRLQSGEKSAKSALILGITLNLLVLGYYKYTGFFLSQLRALIPALAGLKAPQIRLPIGISFFVFQSMSYVIDVYRQDAPVQSNPVSFGTYVTLFPQLIAGPIVRYRDVAYQMDHRKETVSAFASGVLLFIAGLSKKVLLANPMGNLWNLLQLQEGTLAAWTGIAAYTLQIYFDFSGYSDMAIGLGRMVGFEFLKNFDYPYISASITEFWRRWHISLSTWFKEYVYIPLGGNRRGTARQILNILTVWMLTGLWHGASWNFILWGLYYAAALVLEKTVLLKVLKKLPGAAAHLYTMTAVMLGWALFYFEDLSALGAFLLRLFSPAPLSPAGVRLILGYLPLMAAAALASTPVVKVWFTRREDSGLVRWGRLAAAGAGLVLCVASLASQSYNPFIYFRF